VAVDVREPDLTSADALRAAYEAKALAELADADALLGLRPGAGRGPRAWNGPVLGPRIAFVVAAPAAGAGSGGMLDEAAADAASKAADALGAGPAGAFTIASRPAGKGSATARARRLRLAIEAVDPLVVIALDTDAAADVAAAFDLDGLPVGRPVSGAGRVLGSAGDFADSLADAAAKARAWSAMKGIAAAALKTKERPKAPLEGSGAQAGQTG
jgi:hypothetical protein